MLRAKLGSYGLPTESVAEEENLDLASRLEYITSVITLTYESLRVPTAQGKQGKWPKKIPVRENTWNLKILPKHRGFGLLKL